MIDSLISKYANINSSEFSFKERLINKALKSLFGDEFDIHYQKGKLYINSPLNIHFSHTLDLSSDEHIMISSGQGPEKERIGYNYSVWFNPEKDNNGNPIQLLTLINDNGDLWNWQIDFDENGKARIPDGWTPISTKEKCNCHQCSESD